MLRQRNFSLKKKLLPIDLSGAGSEFEETQEAVLGAIQTAAAGQISASNQFFQKLTERFDERHQLLEKSYASKQQELDAIFDEKNARLVAEEARLRERTKELDDRDNTHARRAIRGELITTIKNRQENFSISKDTTKLRWPIHCVFLILLIGTSAGVVWSSVQWTAFKTQGWDAFTIVLLIKSLVFTFGFLTSAGLYVSWMNRWFDRHSEAQFHTKQFEIDINRASWAVEAALEWKASQNEQMPEALLAGITKNLFDLQPGEHANYAPLDALASSILGSASNLKLNVSGNEVSFDRKGIKEIAKKAEE